MMMVTRRPEHGSGHEPWPGAQPGSAAGAVIHVAGGTAGSGTQPVTRWRGGRSGLDVVGHRPQHGGDLPGVAPVGVTAATVGRRPPAQQLDEILDYHDHLVRALAA